MHTVLFVAALAVASGDGRDGATDGRTEQKVPPYAMLRRGMHWNDVKMLMGRAKCHVDFPLPFDDGFDCSYKVGPDCLGRCRTVFIHYSDEWEILRVDVKLDDAPGGAARCARVGEPNPARDDAPWYRGRRRCARMPSFAPGRSPLAR